VLLIPLVRERPVLFSKGASHEPGCDNRGQWLSRSAGSGNFDTNVMYVTGPITSVSVEGTAAVFKGTASVTGLGAGSNLPFVATARAGGPGTTLVLLISGLTFHEIVLAGQITVGK
jgi:hypothetical protein